MPTITGTQGTDILSGGNDADTIFGLGGNDQLTGNGGNDTIEGGSGDDIISGSSGSDILTGGSGADVFRDTMAGLNGDRITDFLPGDRIQITDLNIQTANIGISGSTITFNGNSLTVDNLGPGRLIVREITGGGVEIRLQSIAHNDFNGDGRSDILLRNDNGAVSNWLGQQNGGWLDNAVNGGSSGPTSWQIVGTGDFNGDGRSDVVWRNDNGAISNWLSTESGGWIDNYANGATSAPTSWEIVGTGDFNGDGRDDIVFRSELGEITNWLATASGGWIDNYANALTSAPTSWKIAATGDFNGDGRADILLRNNDGAISSWLGTEDGGWLDNYANALTSAPTSWHIVGTGDFNGDGRDDILFRNDNGAITNWLGQANGGWFDNYLNAATSAPTSWEIAATGDYNGDGRDDILFRNDNGAITSWLGTANGGWFDNSANAASGAPISWHIQPDALWF